MKLYSTLVELVSADYADKGGEIEKVAADVSLAAKDKDVAIAFLVDNSGSMRGSKIAGIACGMSIVSTALSSAAVVHEILGFTTRTWKGGLSREMWFSDKMPKPPGRLNDLRHIVYKSFDETAQQAGINLAILLREGLLKENIDGEAMLWAYSRLQESAARHKILFVLSDGAPVDDSTLSENAPSFLADHAKSVVDWIRRKPDIELFGIGIAQDVSSYYGAGCPTIGDKDVGIGLLKIINLAVSGRWADAKFFEPSYRGAPKRRLRRTLAAKKAP